MGFRYVVIERIAVGGMGEVFVARQQGAGGFRRTVVLKRLLPDAEGSELALTRMLDEARVGAALQHDNVVGILEVGQDPRPFLALEYVHGDNAGVLRTRAAQRGLDLPIIVAARIVADAARGLAHAHLAVDVDGRPLHIVHRDIAPKNIFVRHDGVSKVGDFGIARVADRLSRSATGAITGTLAYMAPEQLRSEVVDARSDQFSLGIVLWELLTGRRLFGGGDAGPVQIAERILKGRLEPPSSLRPEVPRSLDEITMRMLERDPQQRFPDCGEVAVALEDAVPDCAGAFGQAAVAAFLDAVLGEQLRERQRRIESGGSGGDDGIPAAWREPSGSGGAQTVAVHDDATAPLQSALEATRAERVAAAREPETGPTVAARPASSSSSSSSSPVPSAGSLPPARAPRWAAAAAVVAVVAVVAALALRQAGPVDSDLGRTRAYLLEARALTPLAWQAAYIASAEQAGVSREVAERSSEAGKALLEERLLLLERHWQKPDNERQAAALAVVAEEQRLEAAARAVFAAALPAQAARDALDLWSLDSAAPRGWLPPKPLAEMQAAIKKNGLAYMRAMAPLRTRILDAHFRRAGLSDGVRRELAALTADYEATLVQLSEATPEAAPALHERLTTLATRGEALLARHAPPPWPKVIAGASFLGVADPTRWEPIYERAPSQRERE